MSVAPKPLPAADAPAADAPVADAPSAIGRKPMALWLLAALSLIVLIGAAVAFVFTL